jgi:hypothetical protein
VIGMASHTPWIVPIGQGALAQARFQAPMIRAAANC